MIVFHTSISWWSFTGVWVTASLLKSPDKYCFNPCVFFTPALTGGFHRILRDILLRSSRLLLSILILTALWCGCSRFFPWSLIHPVSFTDSLRPFQVNQIQLVLPPLSFPRFNCLSCEIPACKIEGIKKRTWKNAYVWFVAKTATCLPEVWVRASVKSKMGMAVVNHCLINRWVEFSLLLFLNILFKMFPS